MNFLSRDFSNEFISQSYQDIIQRYNSGSTQYLLDLLGNVILSFESSSVEAKIITEKDTASYAANCDTASFAEESLLCSVADVALTAYTSSIATSSSYAITASATTTAYTSSFSHLTNVYAGLTSDILIIDNLDGTITVSTASVNLFSDVNGIGEVVNYSLPETVFSVLSGSANYVVAKYLGGNAVYDILTDASIINQTTIVSVSTVTNIRQEIRGYEYDNNGLALANRLNDRFLKTEKFARESGLSLFNTSSGGNGYIGMTQGVVWDGATRIPIPEFNSMHSASVPENEVYFYYHTNNEYTVSLGSPSDNIWQNGFYDDGHNKLPISSSYYVVNYVWRLVGGISDDEDVSLVIGNQYSTLNEAKDEAVPNAPSDVTEIGILVGRAFLQSGSSIPVLIESSFGRTFNSSPVSNHENLDGLEGGTIAQHYHLTQAEYTGTGTGVFVRASGSIITGSITTSSFSQNSTNSVSSSFASRSLATTSASWASSSLSSSWTQANTISTITSNYVVSSGDFTILCAGTDVVTITLPSSSLSQGRRVILKNRSNFNMYVVTPDGATIDDSLSITSSFKNSSIQLQCSSSGWYIL